MMKNVKMFALAAATTAMLSAGAVQAEQYYGFSNVSVNYLDWSNGTTDRTNGTKTDYFYIEAEGGAGYDWGDVYGFIDIENPTKMHKSYDAGKQSADAFRVSAKGTIAVNMGDTNFNYYGQIFSLTDSSGFATQNYVLGVSYNYRHDSGFWVNPFLGVHYQNDPGSAFFNGGMAGWVGGYDFNLGGQKFSVTNWNEIEFARDSAYAEAAWVGSHYGLNGALAAWWHPTPQLTTGIQYRYADHKLGDNGYDNGIVYTVKYNF